MALLASETTNRVVLVFHQHLRPSIRSCLLVFEAFDRVALVVMTTHSVPLTPAAADCVPTHNRIYSTFFFDSWPTFLLFSRMGPMSSYTPHKLLMISNLQFCLVLQTLNSVHPSRFYTLLKPGTAISEADKSEYGNLMLKQLVLVMIECVVQPVESIARLGCACLR